LIAGIFQPVSIFHLFSGKLIYFIQEYVITFDRSAEMLHGFGAYFLHSGQKHIFPSIAENASFAGTCAISLKKRYGLKTSESD